MAKQNLIRFDWALKRLLRNKANYKVLEGFLSELLREDVTIVNILESEGNQDDASDKFNRVDILVENSKKELIIVELQNSSEVDYFLRMLYGVSRVITNYMTLGDKYEKVRKVYSVNIVYFQIGQGKDYVYHGFTEFQGIHEKDILLLSSAQQEYFGKDAVSSLYPEYYIIKVNEFNDTARDTLDEWIYYLKNNIIKDNFKAKGLAEAREVLQLDDLSEADKKAYIHHIEQTQYEDNALWTSRFEGKVEGKSEALEEVVITGFQNGFGIEALQTLTKLERRQIEHILKEKGLIQIEH